MRRLVLLIQLFFVQIAVGQTPANDPHWELVWEDNFNSLNSTIWLVQNHFDHWGGEPQVYTNRAENVYVSGGILNLKVNKEVYSCPPGSVNQWGCVRQFNTGQPYQYTSGWIETKAAYNTQYGYIESRIKLPNGHGFWPAFWTFEGEGVTGSNAAEIDIFEMLGSDTLAPHKVGTNIHKEYCNVGTVTCNNLFQQLCPTVNPSILCYGQDLLPTNFSYTDWHIYGLEWTPSKITWYIDGFPLRILPNPSIVDPVRIILNLAIEPWSPPNQSTPFPSVMQVDYVRVFDMKNDCNNTFNVCNYNFASYDHKVKKSIVIGNGTCLNTLHSGQNVYLRASDEVLINGDFTTTLGSELYIDVNTCY